MPPRAARFLALLLALAPAGARAADAKPPAAEEETMVERRLKDIVSHQQAIFSSAAAAGKDLDQADLKTQVEGLVHEYESLVKDSPDFAAAWASYGYMLWKVGMRKQAAAALMKANQLDPDIPLVKNELGNYLVEEGKPLEAMNYFLSAIKLEPTEPLYHYQLGSLLYEARGDFLRSGEWTRAAIDHSMQEAFRRASELAPDRIEFTYRYAESFYDMRDPDWPLALKTWQGLEARAQSDVERQTMRLHEANVLLSMGKRDDARRVLAGVDLPELDEQKKKLVARLQPDPVR
jgi:tetratricopeptide (TPR) repeat protein